LVHVRFSLFFFCLPAIRVYILLYLVILLLRATAYPSEHLRALSADGYGTVASAKAGTSPSPPRARGFL
jgi:hypothetical protein